MAAIWLARIRSTLSSSAGNFSGVPARSASSSSRAALCRSGEAMLPANPFSVCASRSAFSVSRASSAPRISVTAPACESTKPRNIAIYRDGLPSTRRSPAVWSNPRIIGTTSSSCAGSLGSGTAPASLSRGLIQRISTRNRTSGSMGLGMKSTMPAAMHSSRSDDIAFAVIATTGIEPPCFPAFMVRVASTPFMFGICMSIRIRS